MALSYNLGYQESISVHPTRRQNFAGKPYSNFPNIWEWLIWELCNLFILFWFVSSSILVPILFKHANLARKMLHILHKQFVMSTQICEGYIIFVGPHISGIVRLQDCINFPWPRTFLIFFIHGDFGFCCDRIRHHLTRECVNKYCQRHRGPERSSYVDLATTKVHTVIWNCFWIIEDLGIIKVHTFEKGYRVTLQFEFKALSDSDKGLSAVACLF